MLHVRYCHALLSMNYLNDSPCLKKEANDFCTIDWTQTNCYNSLHSMMFVSLAFSLSFSCNSQWRSSIAAIPFTLTATSPSGCITRCWDMPLPSSSSLLTSTFTPTLRRRRFVAAAVISKRLHHPYPMANYLLFQMGSQTIRRINSS